MALQCEPYRQYETRILPVHRDGEKIYDIMISGSFRELPEAIRSIGFEGRKMCIVADSHVAPLYGEEIRAACAEAASSVCTFVFPAGEEQKNLDTVKKLYEFLIQRHFERRDVLLALGGGVTGDLTGFAAATYLRGISFIQLPTSLLAQVDSSIGGKTGVDFDSYKNMVGAFHMPSLVYMNLSTLGTLPGEQFAAGMGEVIKHGFIKDASYLASLMQNRQKIVGRSYPELAAMVGRSCEIKRGVVEADPYEKGERALLNFGHTLGHAIERLENFRLLHGECVALGCVAASYISWKRGLITEDDFLRIRELLASYGLPVTYAGHSPEEVLQVSKLDKKMEDGKIKFILLSAVGCAFPERNVTDGEVLEALAALREGDFDGQDK